MSKKIETPILTKDIRAQLKIGATTMCAIRRRLGCPPGSRRMLLSQVVALQLAEPEFTQANIYPRKLK